MTQRIIKFRAWDKIAKRLVPWERMKGRTTGFTFEDNNFEFQQFTGLTDKNGLLIYEGDILEFDYEPLGKFREQIQFIDSGFWIKRKDGINFLPSKEYREIIGNIYENPKLLEEKLK